MGWRRGRLVWISQCVERDRFPKLGELILPIGGAADCACGGIETPSRATGNFSRVPIAIAISVAHGVLMFQPFRMNGPIMASAGVESRGTDTGSFYTAARDEAANSPFIGAPGPLARFCCCLRKSASTIHPYVETFGDGGERKPE